MYISKKRFIILTLLFALLPLSMNWKLFLFGKKATGIVIEHKLTSPFIKGYEKYSLIQFVTQEGERILIYGPENIEYPVGKKIKILYLKDKPEEYVMLNMAGLLLTNKVILPLVILIFWISFYLSFGQEGKKKLPTYSIKNYKRYLNKRKGTR